MFGEKSLKSIDELNSRNTMKTVEPSNSQDEIRDSAHTIYKNLVNKDDVAISQVILELRLIHIENIEKSMESKKSQVDQYCEKYESQIEQERRNFNKFQESAQHALDKLR